MKLPCLILFIKNMAFHNMERFDSYICIYIYFNTIATLGFTTPTSNFVSYFSHLSDNRICSVNFLPFFSFLFFTKAGRQWVGKRAKHLRLICEDLNCCRNRPSCINFQGIVIYPLIWK